MWREVRDKVSDAVNINEVFCNPGAERQILANCIQNKDDILKCENEGLTPKHFAIPINKHIYNTMMYLFTKNLALDAMTIYNLISTTKARESLEEFGGEEYLQLLQYAPTTMNLPVFCNEVIGNYIKRQTYDTCSNIQQQLVTNKAIDPISIINQKASELTLENTKKNVTYKMGDSFEDRVVNMTEVCEVPGLAVGWHEFDRLTGGAQGNDLIVVVAESKTGKSVTLLNWAKNIAINQKLPILWIDSEQTDREEEMRLASIISQVPEAELKTGLYRQDTLYGTADSKIQRVKEASVLMQQSEFFHVFMPDFTLEKVVAKTKEFYLKYGIVAMFFDYIKLTPDLIRQYKDMRPDMALETFTSGLKNLAGELNIPIFTAAQENRGGYGNTEKDAKNIGESLGILKLATKLMFLRNMTDEEIILNPKANQKLLVKYMRHSESNKSIDIFYNRPFITQIAIT